MNIKKVLVIFFFGGGGTLLIKKNPFITSYGTKGPHEAVSNFGEAIRK